LKQTNNEKHSNKHLQQQQKNEIILFCFVFVSACLCGYLLLVFHSVVGGGVCMRERERDRWKWMDPHVCWSSVSVGGKGWEGWQRKRRQEKLYLYELEETAGKTEREGEKEHWRYGVECDILFLMIVTRK